MRQAMRQAMRRGWAMAFAAAVGMSVTSGCSVWGPEGGPSLSRPRPVTTAGASPGQPTGADASPGADGVQRITVTVDDRLRYDPMVIRAQVGTVEITMRNTGSAPHTLGGPALGAGVDNVDGGGTQTVRLTFTQPGRYTFACAYHSANGMAGMIEVADASGG